MDTKKILGMLKKAVIVYWLFVLMIYLVAGDGFHYTTVTSDSLSPVTVVGEIVDGVEVTQRMVIPADTLHSVELCAATYGRSNTGLLHIEVQDEQEQVLSGASVEVSSFKDGVYTTITLNQPIEGRKGESVTLRITSEGASSGNAVSMYSGNMVVTGRFDIVQPIAQEDLYRFNDLEGAGKLCVKLTGMQTLSFYKTYWIIVSAIFAAAALYIKRSLVRMRAGKNSLFAALAMTVTRYRFLIKQLVSRDFKTKYKRSVLGMAWSFLNPLMTMCVQYIVFSTLFKSSTPNYPVYLLSGIVFFNFFNEAVNMGMTSIIGNASLIKKVYMPKYIYPVSRILSSLVNFGLALIPLLLVMILTGTPPRPALLLLLFDVLCLVGFVIGMGLILATCMTFFQDTQFLWGVVSMMWMYLTPIFYTESIIPAKFLTLFHMNPLYQYITFARICIIDGVSPEPMAYLWCVLSSMVVLVLGIFVFKKNQDKFVLYL